MNQNSKRITSMLLSCAMLLTLLPAGALAAETGADQENTVSVTAENGEIEETLVSATEENGVIGESAAPDTEADAAGGAVGVPNAADEEDADPVFAGGSGTQEDPWRIDTLEQLKAFRDSVNSGETYQGKYIRLDADIDLANEEWTPIGGGGTGKQFCGVFDGDGHTISNLKITRGLSYTAENKSIALFGATQGGEIRNFTLHNADVTGSGYVAAVVGGDAYLESKITGVSVTGRVQISGYWYAGGILGNGYTTVTDCSVEGDGADTSYVKITGGYAGGIVGFMGEGRNEITGCSVQDITVEGAYNGIGGISGILHYHNTIRDCTVEDVVVWQTTGPDTEQEDRIYCGAFAGTYLGKDGSGKDAIPVVSKCTFRGALYSGSERTDILGEDRCVGDLWYDRAGPESVQIDQCTIAMPPVAQVGENRYATLAEAVAAAESGGTIKLLADVNLDEAVSFDGSSYALAIEKSLTIDGSSGGGENHTITMSTPRGIAVKGGADPVTVTFENVRLVQTSGRSCIETRGGVDALNLTGAVLDTSGSGGNTQALTIGGDQEASARVHIKDSRIRANAAGYAVIVYNPVEMAVENSQISGYAALYFKAPSSSQGSSGSTVTVLGGSILESANANPQADGANAFGTVVFEDDNITLTVRDATVSASAPETSDRQQVISFSYYNGWNESGQVVTGNRVFFQSGAAAHVNGAQAVFSLDKEGNTITITGGTYNFDPAAYVPDGYVVDGSGPYTVSEKPAPNPPSGGGSSSGSGSTGTGDKTEVTTHPDGSTTTTVTKPNGTVTETTKQPDGSTQVVQTRPDGTTTTTNTDASGNRSETVASPDGSATTKVEQADGSTSTTTVTETGRVESQVELSQGAVDAAGASGTVSLPIPAVPAGEDRSQAPTVTVSLPGDTETRVEVPVENVTAGTVAVLVKSDGTEEVIKTSLTTENGVMVTLTGGETIKIVDNSKSFEDVGSAHWGAEAIDFASSRELFAGTSATTFSPEGEMTRAMVVTVLARYEGVDTTSGSTWYEAGSRWAVENGISDGSDLEGAVTREQLAAMLWRYAGSPASTGSVDGFADGEQVSPWASGAMAWAVESGLLSGMGDGTLNPQGQASRAQVAAILTRFVEMTNR